MNLIPNHKLPLEILFEDSHLLAINKPAGIPVYPLKKEENETVANALVAYDPKLGGVGPPLQAGIIHRLDNDTSGVLVVARNNEVYDKLRSVWNGKKVTKEYTALVLGVAPENKIITTSIAHHPSKKKKMIVCETEGKAKEFKARPAHTELERIQIFKSDQACMGGSRNALTRKEFSLLKIQITTGVRHQIRVHLASIGHPIVGDKLYNNHELRMTNDEIIQRHFLHLSRVEFQHPITKKHLKLVL